jgi:hypothetical protein
VVLYDEEYGDGVEEYVDPVGDVDAEGVEGPLVCGCGRA